MKHSIWFSEGGYSLIEIMTWILIVSIVMISAFYALSAANIWKVRIIDKGDIDREAYYFQEKLVDTIKQGGTIDYEEYFNRQTLNFGKANIYKNGHYLEDSLFWNTSNALYFCLSWNGSPMWTGGCVASFNSTWTDKNWIPQFYWQYAAMAVDYNSDASSDWWDEDGDGNPVGDDDDAYIWDMPSPFSSLTSLTELYLTSWDKRKRTYLRWNIFKDPKGSVSATCTWLNWVPSSITWTWCLGTIEVLKLEWVDWWNDHNLAVQDAWQFDGIIDTWIYDREFYWLSTAILANNSDQYWIPLFSKDVNVKKVSFSLFPNKDQKLAWKDTSSSVNTAPFVKILLVLTPSISRQSGIKWKIPEFTVATTLNLSPIFSN